MSIFNLFKPNITKLEEDKNIKALFNYAIKSRNRNISSKAMEALSRIRFKNKESLRMKNGTYVVNKINIICNQSGNKKIKDNAIELLGKIGSKESLSLLKEYLTDGLIGKKDDWSQRIGLKALEAICNARNAQAVSVLYDISSDRNSYPTDTLEALGKIENAEATKALVRLMSIHEHKRKQSEMIEELLVKKGEFEAPTIFEAMNEASFSVRDKLVCILDNFGWQPRNKVEMAYYLIVKEEWEELGKIGKPAIEPLIHVASQITAHNYTESSLERNIITVVAKMDQEVVETLLDLALKKAHEADYNGISVGTRIMVKILGNFKLNSNKEAVKKTELFLIQIVEDFNSNFHSYTHGVDDRAVGKVLYSIKILGLINGFRSIKPLLDFLHLLYDTSLYRTFLVNTVIENILKVDSKYILEGLIVFMEKYGCSSVINNLMPNIILSIANEPIADCLIRICMWKGIQVEGVSRDITISDEWVDKIQRDILPEVVGKITYRPSTQEALIDYLIIFGKWNHLIEVGLPAVKPILEGCFISWEHRCMVPYDYDERAEETITQIYKQQEDKQVIKILLDNVEDERMYP